MPDGVLSSRGGGTKAHSVLIPLSSVPMLGRWTALHGCFLLFTCNSALTASTFHFYPVYLVLLTYTWSHSETRPDTGPAQCTLDWGINVMAGLRAAAADVGLFTRIQRPGVVPERLNGSPNTCLQLQSQQIVTVSCSHCCCDSIIVSVLIEYLVSLRIQGHDNRACAARCIKDFSKPLITLFCKLVSSSRRLSTEGIIFVDDDFPLANTILIFYSYVMRGCYDAYMPMSNDVNRVKG